MKENLFKNKKVAIIAGRDPSMKHDTDGGSVYLEYLVDTLSDVGAIIDVYIPAGTKGVVYTKKREKRQLSSGKSKVWDNKTVTVHYFSMGENQSEQTGSQSNYFMARIEKSKDIARFFNDRKLYEYDIIYILHMANAFSISEQGLTPPERTVLFPMMTSADYEKFYTVPKQYKQAEQVVCDYMQHICSPSDDEIQHIIRNFSTPKQKLFKIHRGFSDKDFPYKRHSLETDRVLTFFSANGIRPQKDHMFLIPFAKELIKQGVDIHIHLTGNNGKSHNDVYNQYTQKFWQMIEKNNLTTNFTAHGVIKRPELVEIMTKSDYAIYPSISETFGKSALESMASGLPTIVLDDVPAFKEFITDNINGIITPRDPEACAKRILAVTKNRELYKSISSNGFDSREKFNWGHIMQSFIDIQIARKIVQ